VSPFQEPMMEVEEEFAPTSRPTLRYSEPELAEQTQMPRKVRVLSNSIAELYSNLSKVTLVTSGSV